MENTQRAPFASQRPWVLVPLAAVAASVIVTGQVGRDDLLPRVGAYVDAWERELGSVMADETYHQSVVRVSRSGVTRMPNTPPRESRQLISEFTLIHFEEGVSHWLGFRSVRLVDGKGVVVPGPSLADLMKDDRLSWRERWERVRDMNAAFNIGSISRDVNIPTFALAALKMVNQSRFRFSKPRSNTVDGEVLTALDIRETARPTLVSGLRGRDVPLNGTVWLDPREGRVRRTEILLRDLVLPPPDVGGQQHARDEELTSRITVVFGPDANVGTWVPVEMRERYDNSWGEVTTGRATYTNYRKFRTTARLVGPGS